MTERAQKLPILAIVRDAIHFTYMNFNLTYKASWPWTAFYSVFTLIAVWLGMAEYFELKELVLFVAENPIEARRMGLEKLEVLTANLEVMTADLGLIIPLHQVLDNALKILAYAVVGVAMFRVYLLRVELPTIAFNLRDAKSFGAILILGAVSVGLGYLIANQLIQQDIGFAARTILFGMVGFIVGFFIVRFLMVLPAIAVDNTSIGFIGSWWASRGQNWRLYWGMVLVLGSSMPVVVFKIMVGNLSLPLYIDWPIQLMLSMIAITFIAVFLAICYQYLVLGRKDEKIAPLF